MTTTRTLALGGDDATHLTVSGNVSFHQPLRFEDLRNATDLQFDDISSELSRTYHYAESAPVKIDSPVALAVTRGGHRILDAQGTSHYIPATFVRISWRAKPGSPHFVK